MAEFTWEARGRTGEVRKGVMDQRELEELVGLVERAERESRQADTEPSSPDLEAIAAAARGEP